MAGSRRPDTYGFLSCVGALYTRGPVLPTSLPGAADFVDGADDLDPESEGFVPTVTKARPYTRLARTGAESSEHT